MLKANLLPIDELQAVQQEQTRRLIWFFSIMLSCFLAIALVLLFPSYLSVLYREQAAADSLELENDAFEKLNLRDALVEVKELKGTMAAIKTSLEYTPEGTELIATLLAAEEDNVKIQNINVDTMGAVTLSGKANTRDNLLAFKETLKNSGKLQKITVPLDHIVKDTDISFTIQAEVQK